MCVCIWKVGSRPILSVYRLTFMRPNQDLGLSEMVYGIGAGIFFVTYITCGVPLTLFVEKLGTRGGLTIVMFLWGISSFLMSVTIDQ